MENLVTKFSKEELKDIFEKMDWDKNGYITPIEFKSYLAELKKGEEINTDEVYEAFDRIDTDGSKAIHWQEFHDAMMNMAKKQAEVSEDEITRLFREVDLDGDGYISPKEAKRAYKKLSKLLNKENDKAAVDKWLETADFDSDGRISIEEFKLSIAGNSLVDEIEDDGI